MPIQKFPESSKRPTHAPQLPPLKRTASLTSTEGWAEKLKADDPATDPAVKAVAEFQAHVARSFDAVDQLRQSKDPARTAAQHLQDVQKAAERVRQRISQRSKELLESIKARSRALELEVSSSIAEDSPNAAEIRSVIRDMDPEQRAAAIQQAIQDGDKATLGAIVNGPQIASGMTKKEVEAYARMAAKRFAGEQVAALDSLKMADELARRISVESFELAMDAAGSPEAQAEFHRQAKAHDDAMIALAALEG